MSKGLSLLAALLLTGCSYMQPSSTTVNTSTSKMAQQGSGKHNDPLPNCANNVWQQDGLFWFDSTKRVTNAPTQEVFNEVGKKCLITITKERSQ